MRHYLTCITLLIFSLLVFVFTAKAQPSVLYSEKTVKLETLGIENGLSQGYAADVIQDNKGFLWIATKDGLNKFDGYSFKVYRNDPLDSASIADNDIAAVKEDDNGRLWIIFREKGLDVFDTEMEQFMHFTHNENDAGSLSGNDVLFIMDAGNDNHVVITGKGIDLIHLENKQLQKKSNSLLLKRYAFSITHLSLKVPADYFSWNAPGRIIEASGKRILICDTAKLMELKIVPSKKEYTYHNLTPPTLAGEKKINHSTRPFIAEDTARNLLYFQRNINTLLYNGNTKQWQFFSNALAVNNTSAAATDAEGNLWLRNFSGLIKIDTHKKTLSEVKSDDPEIQKKIAGNTGACYKDFAGNIWICTLGYGLLKLNQRSNLFHHARNEGIVNTSTYRITASKNGIFNVVTWDGYEYLFDTSTMQLAGNQIFSKLYDADILKGQQKRSPFDEKNKLTIQQILDSGGFFIKNFGNRGLSIVDPSRNFVDMLHLYGSDYSLLFIDKHNMLWFTANDTLLYKTELAAKKTDSIPLHYGIGSPVTFVTGRNDGNIWLAGKTGLGKYNTVSGKWTIFAKDKKSVTGLRDNNILCLCFDPKQPSKYIWIGFEGAGFCRMDINTGNCFYYTTKEGLPNDVVYGILPDKSGNLWMSTNKGLSRFSPSYSPPSGGAGGSGGDAEGRGGQFTNFDQSDGLQSNEFNRNSSAQSPSGWMMFGGVNGINYFNPEQINSNNYNASIQLTDITINNKTISTRSEEALLQMSLNNAEEIVLPYNYNLVSFHFASLDLTAPAKNKFTYKLEGIDKEWSPVSTKHEASYTYLPPGEYTFRVKGTNSDGNWSSNEVSFSFMINPPWWQTWWFRILLLVFIAGIIYAIFKYRLQQVLKLQAIRNRISADMHDEIGSTLSSITFYSQALLLQTNDEKHKTVLEKIKENAQNVQEGLSDIVWSVKASMDNIENVFSRMYSFGTELMDAKSIQLHFEVDEKLQTQKMEMTKRKNFYLIFKEALNNAGKYAQCSNVWVKIETAHPPHLRMIIKDDGKGFDKALAKNGNGLGNMQQRAAEMKGSLTVASAPGEGTIITLIF